MYELIIVGAGPAGITAGIYAGRFRINSLILEKLNVGGQIVLSYLIENYPGFPEGINPQELIEKFRIQLEKLNVPIRYEEAIEIYKFKEGFKVKTDSNEYLTKSLILATGASPKELGIKGEKEFLGKGVSYCAICDAVLFKNKEVIVVGGGDKALQEAIFLSKYASLVYLVHRRDKLRASNILVEKAISDPKIKFILNTVVEEIKGEKTVEGVKLKNLITSDIRELKCQGVFIFVGIRPNTEFLGDLIKKDDAGFIITDENMQTSQEGIFACGDCRKKTFYQVINACGEAAVAVNSAHNYLVKYK
ncbi:MAG: thioredoxin-disulfide reductase [Candidatus Omnitrophica bacterium]|nr:thioredoxin-disulfide reductase [Candidatus Omnitrophota bacterium]